MQNRLAIPGAACAVCGSLEVRTDAVEYGGKPRAASQGRAETSSWLLLAECPRCQHRWTQPLREVPALARVAVRVSSPAVQPEVASAA